MSRETRSGQSGFTLVEILIGTVVVTALGGALMTLTLGQTRFYGKSDGDIRAQQNLRISVDLMGAELRMAGGGDVLEAEPDRVTIRFDVSRAVVCDSIPGQPDQVALVVFDSVTNGNLSPAWRGTAYSDPWDSAFVYRDGTAQPVTATGATAMAPCIAKQAPSTFPAARYRVVSGWNADFGARPEPGAVVRRYGRLSYRFGPSTSGTGLALFRNSTEVATPFGLGAAFEYVLSDGTVWNQLTGAALDSIRTIRVAATAVGPGANRYRVQRSISYDIQLRN